MPTNAGLYPQASLDNVTFNRVAEFNTDGTIAGNYTIASGVSAYVKLPNVAKYMRMELDIAEVDGGEFTVIYRRYGAS